MISSLICKTDREVLQIFLGLKEKCSIPYECGAQYFSESGKKPVFTKHKNNVKERKTGGCVERTNRILERK